MVEIHCQIVEIDPNTINRNNWNPNEESKDIEAAVLDDINQNGFIGEIVLQKFNKYLQKENVIINGEHRYNALLKLGAKKIPVIILDVNDNKAKTLSIRLNREHGELNPKKVKTILNDLSPDNDTSYLQLETGIPIKELEVLTEIELEEMEIKEQKEEKQSPQKSVTCPSCGIEFKIFN